jgi:alkylhydroperoxidase/carboxymuconolactone decarboxylase family protein YurZ
MSNPLDIFNKIDPSLFSQLEQSETLAFAEGEIPPKYKYLIALAIDASKGATEGVKSLATRAMQIGATREEIAETMRIVYHITGAASMYASAPALREIFENY